jgi:hypothetical protein
MTEPLSWSFTLLESYFLLNPGQGVSVLGRVTSSPVRVNCLWTSDPPVSQTPRFIWTDPAKKPKKKDHTTSQSLIIWYILSHLSRRLVSQMTADHCASGNRSKNSNICGQRFRLITSIRRASFQRPSSYGEWAQTGPGLARRKVSAARRFVSLPSVTCYSYPWDVYRWRCS